MLFICMKIIFCLLSNEYYNWEEKIHLFIDLLYDTLIRDEYSEESLEEWGEIIIESKNISALSLNVIILEYGTKYQPLSNSIFDSIWDIFKGEKQSYLLFYGPLKLISLQNIMNSVDSVQYLKIVSSLMLDNLGVKFKDPCMTVIKGIVKNVYNYYELNKFTLTKYKDEIDQLLETANQVFPELVHSVDYTLELF